MRIQRAQTSTGWPKPRSSDLTVPVNELNPRSG